MRLCRKSKFFKRIGFRHLYLGQVAVFEIAEIDAKADGKDGLILLAGDQLTLGVTLPFVDVVFLLNDDKSSDKIYQRMYRCMAASDNFFGRNRHLV